MVAVLTVFANHLWGWPSGGFVGVDVFFVISGYLISGHLLSGVEQTGRVDFRSFYRRRVKRIVPAATLVLIITYLASALVFLPFRSSQVGIDALWAFVFLSNWHFAAIGTDYFRATETAASPLLHYWSLSIEEQFYVVWPGIIALIAVLVSRRAGSHAHRMRLAGTVMGVIVGGSLAWALYQTATEHAVAYLDTLSRIWELGVGALLAIASGALARIPTNLRPILSWAGLILIGAGLFVIREDAPGFPAPWALLPIAGASLVIGAGVGGEPKWQGLLRNPLSGYIGNISYSLYLVHWPVIILLAAMMDTTKYYYVVVVALAFGLAIASYHGVENPVRRYTPERWRRFRKSVQKGRYWPQRSSQYALLGSSSLVVIALLGFMLRPEATVAPSEPPSLAIAAADADGGPPAQEHLGPLGAELQRQISVALKASVWPQLDPPFEALIGGHEAPPDIMACASPGADPQACTWGSPTARLRAVLVGDSVAMTYAGPLRAIAQSGDQLQVHSEALYACMFSDATMASTPGLEAACTARKQHAVDYINATKPDIVFISNSYTDKRIDGTDQEMSDQEWADQLQRMASKFKDSVRQIVILAPPPQDVNIQDCYGKRSNKPQNCISHITRRFRDESRAEQQLAKALGWQWIDSRPWFCFRARLCPAFVEATPTKYDAVHMSTQYGEKIAPVIGESLRQAKVLP